MNKTLSAVLLVIAVLVLAGGLFFFGALYGRSNAFVPAMMFGPGGNTNAFGPNQMMGGFGRNNGYGPGMMGGTGPGMMGRYGYNNANAATLTVDQARAAALKYLAALNNPDLAIAEVMVFSNNAYVAVKETSTGKGAFELLVDPASQVAYPEHGPNMMWNVKYGSLNHQFMMGGYGGGMMRGYAGWMMGNYGWNGTAPSGSAAEITVTPEQAVQAAQKYLDTNIAGATAAADPMQFYGYYTLDFSKDGKIAGMLSVNGYTGQVFLHTWHATFVQEAQ